jgi:hypothetical protein
VSIVGASGGVAAGPERSAAQTYLELWWTCVPGLSTLQSNYRTAGFVGWNRSGFGTKPVVHSQKKIVTSSAAIVYDTTDNTKELALAKRTRHTQES